MKFGQCVVISFLLSGPKAGWSANLDVNAAPKFDVRLTYTKSDLSKVMILPYKVNNKLINQEMRTSGILKLGIKI